MATIHLKIFHPIQTKQFEYVFPFQEVHKPLCSNLVFVNQCIFCSRQMACNVLPYNWSSMHSWIVMQSVMSCASYANASPCAKLGTKLPTLPTTWAPTFKKIDTILKPTMTKWAILCLFSSFTYLISSPFFIIHNIECHQYFHTIGGNKQLQSPLTYQQVNVVVWFLQW